MNNSVNGYDHVVWEQLCSLEVVGEEYWAGGYNISIVSRNGKYGLIYTQNQYDADRDETRYTENTLCDCKYDSIHNLHIVDASGCFVCFLGGKCGLLKLRCYDGSEDVVECTCALPCIYDCISTAGGCDSVLLCRQGETTCYYNLDTQYLSSFYSSIDVEQGIAICENDGRFSLMDTRHDAVIYCGEENDYLEYCCRYREGIVFKETHGEVDLTNLADIKEDARLLFYSFADKQVHKTGLFHNLKMFLVRDGFAVYLTSFSYMNEAGSHAVCGSREIFSQEDIARIKTYKQ